MNTHSRYSVARKILIFWCLFIGIGAVWGAACMLIRPDGSILHMQGMLPYFHVLPFADVLFQNYIFSGISLLCVNGITNLAAAGLLIAKKKAGIVCGTVFGFTLMAWITIQFIIFPLNFLSVSYYIFGILQLVTGLSALIFYRQEHFFVNAYEYRNVGKNHTQLVVYFSRTGYTKKIAYEKAEKIGADIYELKSTEPTQGTGGFWWCGRFAMHKWDMPVEKINIDFASYEQVTICSPVWVFHLAAPVRSFCRAAKGKINKADYILTHFNRCQYKYIVDETDELLGVNAGNVDSICVRYGRIIKEYKLKEEINCDNTNKKIGSSSVGRQ